MAGLALPGRRLALPNGAAQARRVAPPPSPRTVAGEFDRDVFDAIHPQIVIA
ncbi:hypothetical protein GCM10020219_017850 [Nonomuraea dietziae]